MITKHIEITQVFKTGEKVIVDWRCLGWNYYEDGVLQAFIPRNSPKHRQVSQRPKLTTKEKTSKRKETYDRPS